MTSTLLFTEKALPSPQEIEPTHDAEAPTQKHLSRSSKDRSVRILRRCRLVSVVQIRTSRMLQRLQKTRRKQFILDTRSPVTSNQFENSRPWDRRDIRPTSNYNNKRSIRTFPANSWSIPDAYSKTGQLVLLYRSCIAGNLVKMLRKVLCEQLFTGIWKLVKRITHIEVHFNFNQRRSKEKTSSFFRKERSLSEQSLAWRRLAPITAGGGFLVWWR